MPPRTLQRIEKAATIAAIGAGTGALCGMAVLLGGAVVEQGGSAIREVWTVALFGGLVGGAIGLVTAPPIWWFLLRGVPLRRAVIESALGTLAGAAIAIAAAPSYLIPISILGFLIAAIRLRLWPPASSGAVGAERL